MVYSQHHYLRYKLVDMMFSGRSYLDNKNFKVALNIGRILKSQDFSLIRDAMLLTRELAANIFLNLLMKIGFNTLQVTSFDGIEPKIGIEWQHI